MIPNYPSPGSETVIDEPGYYKGYFCAYCPDKGTPWDFTPAEYWGVISCVYASGSHGCCEGCVVVLIELEYVGSELPCVPDDDHIIGNTLYFTSDEYTVNGVTANKLDVNNTSTCDSFYFIGGLRYSNTIYWLSNKTTFYILHENGSKTVIGSVGFGAQTPANDGGMYEYSLDVNETNIVPTDALLIKESCDLGMVVGYEDWASEKYWVSPQFGLCKLNECTWTIFKQIEYIVDYHGAELYLRFGCNTYPTRIENINKVDCPDCPQCEICPICPEQPECPPNKLEWWLLIAGGATGYLVKKMSKNDKKGD